MNCPTCDHGMQAIGYCDGGTVYHCPRCGTISHHGVYVPALVERCRSFAYQVIGRITERADDVWRRTGIAESINLPKERRAT